MESFRRADGREGGSVREAERKRERGREGEGGGGREGGREGRKEKDELDKKRNVGCVAVYTPTSY